MALDKPVSLIVGDDGIIGRRVSMLNERRLSGALLADGIVGFNSL
jgi:hypothetical protein